MRIAGSAAGAGKAAKLWETGEIVPLSMELNRLPYRRDFDVQLHLLHSTLLPASLRVFLVLSLRDSLFLLEG
ncbi:MAG: hypothetical protein ACFB4I_07010 [Cyanophyceae cyanobacterium]